MSSRKLQTIYIYILACTFILSSISKLLPLSAFEFQLVSNNIASWVIAPVLARCIIAFEFITGIHLIFFKHSRKVSLLSALSLLLFFSFWLAYVLLKDGNQANCGCFGQVLPMSTTAALLKNVVLLLPGFYFFTKLPFSVGPKWIQITTAGIVFLLFFVVFPVRQYQVPVPENITEPAADVKQNEDSAKTTGEERKNLLPAAKKDTLKPHFYEALRPAHSLYGSFTDFSDGKVQLNTGLKIVTLFSLDCEHCLAAAQKLARYKKQNPCPEIYALVFGEQEQLQSFTEQSGLSFHSLFLPPEKFFPLLTKSPPRIVLLAKGNILYDVEGDNFSIDSLKQKLRLYQ